MEITVKNLVKDFGRTRAVDHLNFSFGSGQIFGFVGPNGAGKTTTIRVMATILDPSEGDILVDGISVVQDPEKVRRQLGYMPDSLPTHADMTVRDYVDFYARASGAFGKRRQQIVNEVEDFTGLTSIRDKFLKGLSKGMKQRVSLARALVHDPAVLVLDEPAAGLDPRARIELRDLLGILAQQGKAILISSHILAELSEICHGAVIIEQGRLVHAGDIDSLLRGVEGNKKGRAITIRALNEQISSLHKFLLEQPLVEEVLVNPGKIQIAFTGVDMQAADLLRGILEAGISVIEFRHEKASLEDIFMMMTQGEVQ